jgi:REP element-mobilizing transposase RayT
MNERAPSRKPSPAWLAERCRKASVDVWAYCLMPNHVHLVLTPHTEGGLARAIGETHRRYTGFINARARAGPAICSRAVSRR